MVIKNKEGQETKKEKAHKNLLIVFTAVGIISFSLGALVNYHTLKKINK
jgi:hypothetical protein